MTERTPTHRRQCDRDAAAIHYQAQADIAELMKALKAAIPYLMGRQFNAAREVIARIEGKS